MNGPAVTARGSRVAVTWFTMEGGTKAQVKLVLSSDFGATFDKPTVLDDSAPIGRVDAAYLDDDSLVVCWVATKGRAAVLTAALVSATGRLGPAVAVAEVRGTRSSGFPRLASLGDRALIAWTSHDGGRHVATAVLVRRPEKSAR